MTAPFLQNPCMISVGPRDEITDHAIEYLQNSLCPHRRQTSSSHCRCGICHGIAEKQSAYVTWVAPTDEYLLQDLDLIFETIRFSLEPNENHIFIIEQAELLTPACANRLLKVLEEPPRGYHFLLLTTDLEALLPTIQSRCVVIFEKAHESLQTDPLLTFFIDPKKLNDPQAFEQMLKAQAPTISRVHTMVKQLAMMAPKTAYVHKSDILILLETAQRNLPQPGGGIHFLKWLYTHMHYLEHMQ